MIQITCRNNNNQERIYAIDIMLHHLLGIAKDSYDIVFSDEASSYCIKLNDKRIFIEDHFFLKCDEPKSYLKADNIPNKLSYFHFNDNEIPIIYGVDKFVKEKNGDIVVGLDIFASVFFMLTRWEELFLGREEKGDCNEEELFAVRNKIQMRPVVNEYEDLLKHLLASAGLTFKPRQYNVVLSHDVDGLCHSWFYIAKDFVRRVLRRPAPKLTTTLNFFELIKYKRKYPNSFSQIEPYTELCQKCGIQEIFFIKVCKKDELESTYIHDGKDVAYLIKRLDKMNSDTCIMGFHPSQSTFSNKVQWEEEVSRYKALFGDHIKTGRNHHLLYNSETLTFWENHTGRKNDNSIYLSNCVFHRLLGFRSGTVVPYPLFDIHKRREMNVIEHPCCIMDTSIRLRNYNSESELWNDINNVTNQVRKHQGELLLTWHIYVRDIALIDKYIELCKKIVHNAVNGKDLQQIAQE